MYIVRREPLSSRTDNTAARHVSYNPELHDRMKHVARRHFFVRDMVEYFEINVPFVPTKENVADFFTKSLPAPAFFAFRKIHMNERDQASPPSKFSPLLVGLAMVEGGRPKEMLNTSLGGSKAARTASHRPPALQVSR
jgi:hypothetical protein